MRAYIEIPGLCVSEKEISEIANGLFGVGGYGGIVGVHDFMVLDGKPHDVIINVAGPLGHESLGRSLDVIYSVLGACHLRLDYVNGDGSDYNRLGSYGKLKTMVDMPSGTGLDLKKILRELKQAKGVSQTNDIATLSCNRIRTLIGGDSYDEIDSALERISRETDFVSRHARFYRSGHPVP